MKLDIQQEQRTVFIWKCPICKKELRSLFKKQLQSNAESHLKAHETE